MSTDSPWYLSVGLSPLYLAAAAVIGLVIWLEDRGSPCPHCKRLWSPAFSVLDTMVTGRCVHCGHAVFDDDTHDESALRTEGVAGGRLLTCGELDAVGDVALRLAWRRGPVWASVGAVWIGICALFAAPLRDWSFGFFGEVWGHLLMPLVVAPGVAIGFWSLGVWSRHASASLPCPSCGEKLSPWDSATKTGYCEDCGMRAVADPFPGLASPALSTTSVRWDVEEYRSRVRAARDWQWLGCLIGGGPGLLWIMGYFWLFLPRETLATPVDLCVALFGAGVAIVFQVGGVFLWDRISERKVRCPACDEELLNSPRVISSKRCYHCGEVVLNTPVSKHAEPALTSQD